MDAPAEVEEEEEEEEEAAPAAKAAAKPGFSLFPPRAPPAKPVEEEEEEVSLLSIIFLRHLIWIGLSLALLQCCFAALPGIIYRHVTQGKNSKDVS